ncbi:Xaa-Pro peptidase family protein [Pseudoflavonifractor sp. MSJ-37]|uniref:M24 family metallopeptidase n=1 Tax=Pseudoflavonifractor sp. MSJ-37 TaxID=2841531 RepID=UPI001C0FA026|nr:aminopeptidase P family protein [Pseudoflavonifractor sp. MSJ-37]MBU5434197.1 aminopeptidase P family protein [Pseudoflavonifractor sp. MSJ-37]
MDHLTKIAAQLEANGLDAMLVTSEPGEFYAIGFHGEGVLVVGKDEKRYSTDSRYIEAAGQRVAGAKIAMTDRARTHMDLTVQAVKEMGVERLGFEEGYMSVAAFRAYEAALPCELVPAQGLIDGLRAAKDAGELDRMEKAQAITDQAFTAICQFIRPGMTEQEIAARLVYEMLRLGAEKMSFDPIVVSGPNGSLPHGIPSGKPVREGEFITMDFGCKWGGYCSDMTRTVALGKPSAEMERVYHTVLEAQLAGLTAARAGVPGKVVDAAARKVIEDAGYGPYFGHGFGHSLGIEIHEAPNANAREERLMPVGAVVSAEPGIYLPGRFGVRIEDVAVYTEEGCQILTKSPKELIIL